MSLNENLFGFSKKKIEEIDGRKVSIKEWNGAASLLNKEARTCPLCGKKITKGLCVNEVSLLSDKLIGFFCNDSCFKKYMDPEERKRRAEEFEKMLNDEQ